MCGKRPADGSLAASCEDLPRAARLVREIVEIVEGAATLSAAQLCARDGAREAVVPLLAAREHEQVLALRIRVPFLRRGEVE